MDEAIYPYACVYEIQIYIYIYGMLVSIYTKYASARCERLSGESFLPRIDSLLWPLCHTAQLGPIHLWRIGHGRVVRTLATTVGGEGCL